MTVSCIVPVYNSEKYLKKCVDSLLSQTRLPDELVLVDDGSTDQSPTICDLYAGENHLVKVLHKENGGLVSAWKAGVEASSGELLSFVDADDYVDRDYFERLMEGIDEGNSRQMVVAGGITEDEDTGRKTGDLTNSLPAGVYEGKELKDIHGRLLGNEIRTVSLSRCMKLISAALVRDNKDFAEEDLTMGEDVSIMLPALLDAERLSMIRHSGYHYVRRSGSMVQGWDSGMHKQIKKLDGVIGRIAEEKKMPEGALQRKREYVWLLSAAVRNAFKSNDKVSDIRRICEEEDTPRLIRETGLKPASLKNRILFYVMKDPSPFRISVAGAVLR